MLAARLHKHGVWVRIPKQQCFFLSEESICLSWRCYSFSFYHNPLATDIVNGYFPLSSQFKINSHNLHVIPLEEGSLKGIEHINHGSLYQELRK